MSHPSPARRRSAWQIVALIVIALVVAVFLIGGVAVGGIPGLLLFAGLFALLFAAFTLVTGRGGPLFLRSRKMAAGVLALSLVATGVGATLSPAADSTATATSTRASEAAGFATAASPKADDEKRKAAVEAAR